MASHAVFSALARLAAGPVMGHGIFTITWINLGR